MLPDADEWKKHIQKAPHSNKHIIWLYLIVVSVVAIIDVIHWNLICSFLVTTFCMVLVLLFSIFVNSTTHFFQETDKYRVFCPEIQTVVAVAVLEMNLLYYSNFFRITNSTDRSVYDYMSYCAIFIIGISLFVAVRMKTILFVQFFHIILIPICFFIVMSLPVNLYVNIPLAIIGVYSLFQVMMTDKFILERIKNNFNKYH